MRKRSSIYCAFIVLLATPILFLSPSLSFAMTNVTDKVQLEESDWVKGDKAKTKYANVSVKNISEDVLWKPIRVVIESLSDPRLTVNADGTTEDGKPYFEYSDKDQLGAGESTDSKEWVFSYPSRRVKFGHKLSFTISVWSCTDNDGDGYFLEADCGTSVDCDDSDPLINPAAEEICDYADNNCDGQIDEGVTTTYYLDEDDDGYGGSTIKKDCSQPDHYVLNSDDCDDDNPYWWKSNSDGNCEFSGYLDCSYPYEMYEKNCNPPVTNVEDKLEGLSEDDNIKFDKDYFSWRYWSRPGEALSDSEKTHLQSIQYIETKYPEELNRETIRNLVVTMSDETLNHATVSLVRTNHFASDAGDSDQVQDQSDLYNISDIQDYNHAGGSQIIGEYLFVALEDFNGDDQSDPKTGVWRIERGANAMLRYQYSFQVNTGDAHHTAVGVTRLTDETYLAAACVEKGCDTIRFYKSAGTSLSVDDSPEFVFVDEWEKPADIGWPNCGDPQNLNMVVDATGDIYVVMFGMQEDTILNKSIIPCETGEHDDHIYVYKLYKTGNDISLQYKGAVDIDAGGNNCECVILDAKWPPVDICGACSFESGCWVDLAVSGTNFMAASGLWIRPDGKDDIAILSTEHYDSCGIDSATGDGASRWGVTENWK